MALRKVNELLSVISVTVGVMRKHANANSTSAVVVAVVPDERLVTFDPVVFVLAIWSNVQPVSPLNSSANIVVFVLCHPGFYTIDDLRQNIKIM